MTIMVTGQEKRVGLALSGGGFRAAAFHLGVFRRLLAHGILWESLPQGPRLYLNATNLATGNMFFFVTGGGGPAEMGEWELGTVSADNFELSRAVAASSAFPPVFPPLRLDPDEYPAGGVDYVTLSDGGVYDNLGVNPLMRSRNALDYVIVSDAGKPFEIDERPTESGTAVLVASIDILMEQVRGLQFRRLELSASQPGGLKPVWFSINSEKGEVRAGDAAFASAIRTHLKRLSKAEMDVLTRHAGALLERRLQEYTPELLA